MLRTRTTRKVSPPWLMAASALVGCFVAVCGGAAADAQQQSPAPIERRAPAPHTSTMVPPGVAGTPTPFADAQRRRGASSSLRGEHLAEWMSQHSNLSPQQQQQALTNEPGFRELPSQTQQRTLNRLQQLDSMNPNQRRQLLEDNEMLERMTPAQHQQFTGALQQLGSLPPVQRAQVARTFRLLRDIPPSQRIDALNSGRFGPPLNGYQRDTLIRLLQVEPFMPVPEGQMRAPQY